MPNHEKTYEQYLVDLASSVDHVRSHPELANTGGAATYGMIAHLPFRKMVKKQILDMFAGMYAPGGQMLDMSDASMADDGVSDKEVTTSGMPPFIDGIITKYVAWKRKKS